MNKQKLANGFRLSDLSQQIKTKGVGVGDILGDTPCLLFRPLSEDVSPLFYTNEFHGSSSSVFKFSETGTLNPKKEVTRAHGYLDPAAVVVPLWKSKRNALAGVITLGRASTSDIRINSKQVSKNHAFVSKNEEGKWQLIDNYSTNGTFINETQLEPAVPHYLTPNCEIKIGVIYAVFLPKEGVEELCSMYDELGKGTTQRIHRKPVCPSCGKNPVKAPTPSCSDRDGCAKPNVEHKKFNNTKLAPRS